MTRNTQLTAKDLHAFYEKAYSQDHKEVFTKYVNGVDTGETNKHLQGLWDWSGKRVLDKRLRVQGTTLTWFGEDTQNESKQYEHNGQ